LAEDLFEQAIRAPLEQHDLVHVTLETQITDANGKRVAVARVIWQIKRWDKVRTC